MEGAEILLDFGTETRILITRGVMPYSQTSNISRTSVANKIIDHLDVSALLQPYINYRLNTRL